MLTSGKSDAELIKAAKPRKKPIGWQNGNVDEVTEDVSQSGDPMFKCVCSCVDEAQETWKIWVNLVDKGKGAWLLSRLCAARGVASKYAAGSVDASDLTGPLRLKLGLEERRSMPDRLKAEDFGPPSASVISIRNAG
jgi:hypothetical protein